MHHRRVQESNLRQNIVIPLGKRMRCSSHNVKNRKGQCEKELGVRVTSIERHLPLLWVSDMTEGLLMVYLPPSRTMVAGGTRDYVKALIKKGER
jgi:hypothetical protein